MLQICRVWGFVDFHYWAVFPCSACCTIVQSEPIGLILYVNYCKNSSTLRRFFSGDSTKHTYNTRQNARPASHPRCAIIGLPEQVFSWATRRVPHFERINGMFVCDGRRLPVVFFFVESDFDFSLVAEDSSMDSKRFRTGIARRSDSNRRFLFVRFDEHRSRL